MTSTLRRRIERLERGEGTGAVFHVVGTDAEANDVATACVAAKVHLPLIIVTGVERTPEQVSWGTWVEARG